MTDTHVIVHIATDTIDSFILTMAQIALALSVFAASAGMLFLIDYFKRHGWQYHHRSKKEKEKDKEVVSRQQKIISSHHEEKHQVSIKKGRTTKKAQGAPINW